MKEELNQATESPKQKQSTKDMSYSKKQKTNNLKSHSEDMDPMANLDKERIEEETAKENVEVESETVKVVKIPNSKLLKAYYWKKEDETFLAIGTVGVEKRKGDQTEQLQNEYKEMGTDQMIKVIAAMIEAQETIKK